MTSKHVYNVWHIQALILSVSCSTVTEPKVKEEEQQRSEDAGELNEIWGEEKNQKHFDFKIYKNAFYCYNNEM